MTVTFLPTSAFPVDAARAAHRHNDNACNELRVRVQILEAAAAMRGVVSPGRALFVDGAVLAELLDKADRLDARPVPKNETEQDAFLRVLDARTGAFAGATDSFLLALKAQLHRFVEEIDHELASRIAKSAHTSE